MSLQVFQIGFYKLQKIFRKFRLFFPTSAIFILIIMLFGILYANLGHASLLTAAAPLSTTALSSYASSSASPIQIFPLDNYDQNIDHWINANDPNYQKPLVNMDYQKKRLKEFYQHYFSSDADGLSPWSQQYVLEQFNSCPSIHTRQKELLNKFNNENKEPELIGHGVHFRPYDKNWIEKITDNMDIEQFKGPILYKEENRAIFVQNAYARALPSQEPYYYHHSLPGEGYPFDGLQMSSIWVGTPAYILGMSKDKNWSLVLTPDFMAWVQSENLAKANKVFIQQWQRAAKNRLAAITQTETAIIDAGNKHHQFKAYVGSIFPLIQDNKHQQYQILFPSKDLKGTVQIRKAMVNKNHAAEMPLAATAENFVKLIKTLQNRPYGWGGLYFLNDCSAELKSLYTPFGFWLARHSSEQVKAGKQVDKSNATPKEKIAYLKEQGRPFMTFVYNTKHVFIYLGSFSNPNAKHKEPVPLTYQNLWGLKPLDDSRRAVVGKALIFPLLETFPEDRKLNSHANHKDFQVIFLDEWP